MILRPYHVLAVFWVAFLAVVACSRSAPAEAAPEEMIAETETTPEVAEPPAANTNEISINFLSVEANRLLSDCSNRLAEACDAAQRNEEISNDGVFSRIHSGCNSGDQSYCALLDGLVAAELRMHGLTPESAPGTGTGAVGMMITPSGSRYDCGGEILILAFEAGAAYITDLSGQSVMLPLLDENSSPSVFTNGRLTITRSSMDGVKNVALGRGRAIAQPCEAIAGN